jgi:hypothetical protein
MAPRVVFNLDEVELGKLLDVLEVRLHETAGHEDREGDALVEQIVENGLVEGDRLAGFASIEGQSDDLLVRRQTGDDLGAHERRRAERDKYRDDANPPHASIHDARVVVMQVASATGRERKCGRALNARASPLTEPPAGP